MISLFYISLVIVLSIDLVRRTVYK